MISSNFKMSTCRRTRFKPVTHVIFDMDGLLLDTERRYTEIVQSIIGKYDKTYTFVMKLSVMGMQSADAAKRIVEAYKLPLTWQEFLELHKKAALQVMANAQLMPGANRLLWHFYKHKIPLALATSSGSDLVDLKTTHHRQLFNLFHHKVCGSTDPAVKRGKPAPDIYLIAASRFPTQPCPASCLVFEDAPNGVQSARGACMQCVMVPDERVPGNLRRRATLVLNSLADFQPEEFGLPPFDEDSQRN